MTVHCLLTGYETRLQACNFGTTIEAEADAKTRLGPDAERDTHFVVTHIAGRFGWVQASLAEFWAR